MAEEEREHLDKLRKDIIEAQEKLIETLMTLLELKKEWRIRTEIHG